jgi:hypothetical protein
LPLRSLSERHTQKHYIKNCNNLSVVNFCLLILEMSIEEMSP